MLGAIYVALKFAKNITRPFYLFWVLQYCWGIRKPEVGCWLVTTVAVSWLANRLAASY